ncbi:MAG TPA: hypothetical protein VGK56_19170 [Anaerolineales bacterium]
MRRFPWGALLLALLIGAGLGLGYAWILSPRPVTTALPSALRADFKDQYRSLVAAAYAATGNLPRAKARLSVSGDVDPVEALNGQAQRMLARAQPFERADQVVALAAALVEGANGASLATPTLGLVSAGNTFTPSPVASNALSSLPTETPEFSRTHIVVVETQITAAESTVGPTSTFTPTPGEPFVLTGQETTCDTNLPEGLLQVIVLNRNRRQLSGVEILITWEGGGEQFFTGLKPELGNGYADYTLSPDIIYNVQLARGSEAASGITVPDCQTPDGEAFVGGIKLTFQQP